MSSPPSLQPPPLEGRWGYPEAPARGTLPGGEPGGDEGRGPGSERGRTQRWRRQRPAAPGRSAPPAEHRHTGAEPSGAHLPRPGGSCATPPLRAKEQGGPALKAQGQDWGARGGGRWPAAPWGSERQRPRGGEGDAPSPELRWGPRGAEETLRGGGESLSWATASPPRRGSAQTNPQAASPAALGPFRFYRF